MPGTKEALRAEVAALREEVRQLREVLSARHEHGTCAHLHYDSTWQPRATQVIPWAQPYTAPQIICGQPDGITAVNLPYTHTAGAAPTGASYVVSTSGAN